MKNILLATDFSINAEIAAKFAAELCRRMGARLVAFHALPPISKFIIEEDGTPVVSPEVYAQKKLDALAHELHDTYGISVSRLLKPGFAEDEIAFVAKNLKAELIVLGAQGDTVRLGSELGLVATEIMKNKDIPVVCIPPDNGQNKTNQKNKPLKPKLKLSNTMGRRILKDLDKQMN